MSTQRNEISIPVISNPVELALLTLAVIAVLCVATLLGS